MKSLPEAVRDAENANPNSGRQTPICHRRPLQRIAFNTVALSPTKRRKQSHAEESPVQDTPKLNLKDDVCIEKPSPRRGDRDQGGNLLLEVFSRLSAKDLVDNVAPACKLWREVAQSKELWAKMRRHLRLVDQLVVIDKVVERRSKGRLFKCKRLGSEEAVLLRIVDLELTNAGKDDGMPTSFLREAALLSQLKHPNLIKHCGAEILGKRAVMCTEFVHENFSCWYKRLEMMMSLERCVDIRVKFRQVLTGLSHLHHQGIMHRNLKPDNLFLDLNGTVKLGDFTTTRMLDIPFQAYTPEDPKERDRSGREMKRLWYRAPELVLRDEIYGPKVDAWSVGCLLAEAASGRPLFQSDSEIDHLFRVFRTLGTPTPASWPEVVGMKNFSPKFPIYAGFSLAQVTRASCCDSAVERDILLSEAQVDRREIIEHLMLVAAVLGPEGMLVLDRLVTVPPSARAGCDATLDSPFFSNLSFSSQMLHPLAQSWLDGQSSPNSPEQPRSRPRMDDTPSAVLQGDDDCPPVSIPSTVISSQMVWNILNVMQQQERCAAEGHDRCGLPSLPPGFDAGTRAVVVDFLMGLANTLSLRDNTMHLAVEVLNKYLSLQDTPIPSDKLQVVGATCLKVSDVFAEQSKEYYKQENAGEYAEATLNQTSSEKILLCEKDLLPKLDFQLHQPTIHWFAQCYLAYGRFNAQGQVGKTSFFISDLMLLDYELLAYTPSLKAQCALLLSVFLVQQAQRMKLRKATARAESATSDERTSRLSPEDTDLSYLEHWDSHIRDRICCGNVAVDASMCLQAVVKVLVEKRREWKSVKLNSVETRHAALVRTLAYPERFPVSKLVRYILPDCQQGLIPA